MENLVINREVYIKNIEATIEEALKLVSLRGDTSIRDNKIAEIIVGFFGKKIVSTDNTDTLFVYYNHRWVEDKENEHIKKVIIQVAKTVDNKRLDIEQEFQKEADEKNEPVNIKTRDEKTKNYIKLVNILQKNSKKIISACKNHCKTIEQFDKKTHLLGFNNGVYDLQSYSFREGIPEDYISKTVGYDYNEDITFDCDDVKFVMNVISQILPNEDIRNYILKVFANCLYDVNKDQSFWICKNNLGISGNPLLMEFMLHVLGSNEVGYANKLNVELLFQKRNDAKYASSEIAKLIGKRFTYTEIPKKDFEINIERMKDITGRGRLIGRLLNKNYIEFQNTTNLFMSCNELPNIPPDEQDIWKRIKTVKFPSQFIQPDSLNERILQENYKMAMMYILLNYHKKYLNGDKNIHVPKKVKEDGERFYRSQDKIGTWITTNIEIIEGSMLRVRSIRDAIRRAYNRKDIKKVTSLDIEKKIICVFEKELKTNDVIKLHDKFFNLHIKSNDDGTGPG